MCQVQRYDPGTRLHVVLVDKLQHHYVVNLESKELNLQEAGNTI